MTSKKCVFVVLVKFCFINKMVLLAHFATIAISHAVQVTVYFNKMFFFLLAKQRSE